MKHFSQITFSLLLACHASLCLAASPRVALMPSGDAKATAIVDLMRVELAQRDDVVLLDRTNVGRMLGEQKMVLEGGLSADDAFAIGQLLGCDVFGELHFQAGGDGASAVGVLTAFDGVTGVRLCDVTLDVSLTLDQIAADASRSFAAALRKQGDQEPGGKIRAVTLLSLRNVDLPSEQQHLVDVLGPIIERRLLQSPGITLLERKRLEKVNQEASLTQDLRAHLLASTVLLDLDLTRGQKEEDLSMRAVVSNPAGKEIAILTSAHKAADLQGLVDVFVQELLSVLELPVVGATGHPVKREAARFASETRRLLAKNRLEDALIAAECAHALHPSDIEIQAMLCGILERVSQEHMQKKAFEAALQSLERAWSFRQQWQSSGNERRSPYPQASLRSMLEQHQALSVEQQERFLHLRHLFRERWLSDPYRRLDNVDLWAETPDEWMDTLLAYGKGYPEEFSTPRFEHLVLGLSMQKKQELMALNEQRAQAGDPRGFVECVMLTHHMRDVMPDAEQKINNYLTQFVDEAIEDKDQLGTGR